MAETPKSPTRPNPFDKDPKPEVESARETGNGSGQLQTKIFREHEPLVRLLGQIPTRIHRGMVGYDLSLTCIAAHSRFLALGTNAGLVYWYDRQKDQLSRLWCSDRRTPVTKLAIVETVDLMVAVGSESGCVTIFQIPRPVDLSIFPTPAMVESVMTSSKEAIEHAASEFFTIDSLHPKVAITALAWAQNGMKLFSGDQGGLVCLTEIDFEAKSTVGRPLSKEGEQIVQLSYGKPILMVSTTERTIVIDTSKRTDEAEVGIVGERPRRVVGLYGGIMSGPKTGLAVRPKNTLYTVAIDAYNKPLVSSTVLMDKILQRPHLDIPLINPMIFRQTRLSESNEDDQSIFEDDMNLLMPVLVFNQDGSSLASTFVAHNATVLHVIQPLKPAVICSCSGLRNILDLSTVSSSGVTSIKSSDEIFVLEGPRSVVRLAQDPDPHSPVIKEEGGDPLNPCGKETTEGLGLESVGSNLISMSGSVVSKLPTLPSLGSFDGAAASLASVGNTAISSLGGRLNIFGSTGHDESTLAEETGEEAEDASADKKKEDVTVDDIFADEEDIAENEEVEKEESLGKLRLELFTPEGESSASNATVDGDDKDDDVSPEEKEASLMERLNLTQFLGGGKKKASKKDDDKAMTDQNNPHDGGNGDTDSKLEIGESFTTKEVGASSISSFEVSSSPSKMSKISSTPCETGATIGEIEQFKLTESKEISDYEKCAGWRRFNLPSGGGTFDSFHAQSSDSFIMADSEQNVTLGHVREEEDGSSQIEWKRALFQAERIESVKTTGSSDELTWRLSEGRVSAPKSTLSGNVVKDWFELPKENILQFSLGRAPKASKCNGVILTRTREVILHQDITAAEPFKERGVRLKFDLDLKIEVVRVASDLILAVAGGKVFGHLVSENQEKTAKSEWIAVPSLPGKVTARDISVNHRERGETSSGVFRVFVVSSTNSVHFAQSSQDDLLFKETVKWSQITVQDFTTQTERDLNIYSNGSGVFFWHEAADFVLSASSVLVSSWKSVDLGKVRTRAKDVCAGGLYLHEGVLWVSLYSAFAPNKDDLFYTKFHDKKLHKVDVPVQCPLAALASAPGAFWILTSDGEIYMRRQVEVDQPQGSGWTRLDLSQVGPSVKFVSLSLGSDVAWAVDMGGNMWMRLGCLRPEKLDPCALPVWIQVEANCNSLSAAHFSKVAISPSALHIVWATDIQHNVYVRQGVFPDYRLGIDWQPVAGLTAVSICASESGVFALTGQGKVHRRCGITKDNFIGDYWQAQAVDDSPLSGLAVTVCDRVFGITNSTGRLTEQCQSQVNFNSVSEDDGEETAERFRKISTESCEDWTVVK